MVLAALLLLLAALPAPALTLVYTEHAGAETTCHTFLIEPAAGGFTVEVSSQREGRLVVFQRLETDPGFSVLSWRWVEEGKATDVTAIRNGSSISLTGRYEGREVSRRFTVGDDPWYQLFPHGLEPLALAGKGSVKFWAIGTTGISAMRIGTFRAVVAGPEQAEWSGSPGAGDPCARLPGRPCLDPVVRRLLVPAGRRPEPRLDQRPRARDARSEDGADRGALSAPVFEAVTSAPLDRDLH